MNTETAEPQPNNLLSVFFAASRLSSESAVRN